MDKRLSIYVSSPDSYSDVLAVFLKGYRRYWSDCPYEFILTTNTKSYEGITCICNSLIEQLLDYMDSHEIRYCNLGPTPKGSKIKSFPLLRSVNKQIPYAFNLQFGIFRKDLFVELLGDGSLSAWDIENSINEQAAVAPSEDYKDVVAVSEYVLPYIHGVYKGKWIRHAVENLSRLSLYIDSGRGVVPLSQQIKIDMTNWLQWKISPKQRRALKNVLSRVGMKFATKR